MRNGEIVDTCPITPETSTKEIVEKMLGRTFEEIFSKEEAEIGEVGLHRHAPAACVGHDVAKPGVAVQS